MSLQFKVTEDQRSDLAGLVRSCLGKNWRAASNLLAERIEASVSASINANEGYVRSEDRAQLARLIRLLTSSQAQPIGLIRARVAALSPSNIRLIEARVSRLAGDDTAFAPIAFGFQKWAKSTQPAELVRMLERILFQGGRIAPGRNRPGGKRSAPHFEASIAAMPNMQKNKEGYAGGRPERDDLRLLISFLAVDWLQSTGLPPDKGRSDITPFGALVFMVLRWIGEEDKATHSLRTYWSPPRPRPKKKPTAALSQG